MERGVHVNKSRYNKRVIYAFVSALVFLKDMFGNSGRFIEKF